MRLRHVALFKDCVILIAGDLQNRRSDFDPNIPGDFDLDNDVKWIILDAFASVQEKAIQAASEVFQLTTRPNTRWMGDTLLNISYGPNVELPCYLRKVGELAHTHMSSHRTAGVHLYADAVFEVTRNNLNFPAPMSGMGSHIYDRVFLCADVKDDTIPCKFHQFG